MLPAEHCHMKREKELEESLVKRGWQIIHPETLTLKSQINYLKSAHVIASPIGSALHLLMYLGKQRSYKQVIGLGLKSGKIWNLHISVASMLIAAHNASARGVT